MSLKIELSYNGNESINHKINFYDVATAMIGFQRSLALTTHLVLNGEIITQAPSLRNASLLALPPEAGSWKIIVSVMFAVYTIGTVSKDSPIGNLVSSAYDYVISKSLGFHVDYDKTLGQQYEELQKTNHIPPQSEARFNALTEKCEAAIKDIHRPIVKSQTATEANFYSYLGSKKKPFQHSLNYETFLHMSNENISDFTEEMVGQVSSYNINTYKGRIYIPAEGRPLPFELGDIARNGSYINLITSSLNLNAKRARTSLGSIRITAFKIYTKSGQIKNLLITKVEAEI